jgi:mono/diheme cytochrome c family protein
MLVAALALPLIATPPGAKQQVLVPAYQAAYSPSDDLLRQILEEVRGIRAELRMGPLGLKQDGAGLLQGRCSACHQDGVADDKGGGFVLVEKDGALAELSLAEKRRVKRLVEQGKMPPGGGLPEAERKLVVDFMNNPEKEKKRGER